MATWANKKRHARKMKRKNRTLLSRRKMAKLAKKK